MGILTKRTVRILALLGATLLNQACGDQRPKADCATCGFYTDAAGEKLWHWPDGSQVSFVLESGFPAEMRPSMVEAGKTYAEIFSNTGVAVEDQSINPSAPVLARVTGTSPTEVRNQTSGDNINGIYWVDSVWPWINTDRNSDAMTVVKFRRGRIVEADLYIRAESFPLSNSSSLALTAGEVSGARSLAGSIDVKWLYVIAVHELGHALGRVHAEDEDSVMFPTVGLEFLTQPFSQWDLDIFSKAYKLRN